MQQNCQNIIENLVVYETLGHSYGITQFLCWLVADCNLHITQNNNHVTSVTIQHTLCFISTKVSRSMICVWPQNCAVLKRCPIFCVYYCYSPRLPARVFSLTYPIPWSLDSICNEHIIWYMALTLIMPNKNTSYLSHYNPTYCCFHTERIHLVIRSVFSVVVSFKGHTLL